MNPSDRKAVESWLLTHHGVRQEVLTGKSEQGGRRFRYRGFTLTWYHTGTILLQGPGLGSARFKGLKCETCKDKPLIIQGLEYMVTQADKRNKEIKAQHQTSPVLKRPGIELEE